MVDLATYRADQAAFDSQEEISEGLGPLYNAHACRDCHENPVAGGASQVTELRAGHVDAQGVFHFPEVRLAGGTVVVTGRTLINDKAICPGAEFPEYDAQEHLPDGMNVRAFRLSISLLGDGYVEAVPDELLQSIARWQCGQPDLGVCGTVMLVPVLESPDRLGVGRFGWKSEHASLLSFSSDAYLNEMGVTSRLRPTDVVSVCDTVPDPEDHPDATGTTDLDRFARFIRATKAPPRDARLGATAEARDGSTLFESIGCAVCHAPTLTTAPPGTPLFGGAYRVPQALGDRTIHPYSDYLMHDVGTGMESSSRSRAPRTPVESDAGVVRRERQPDPDRPTLGPAHAQPAHARRALLHPPRGDLRHQGEAKGVRSAFDALAPSSQEQLLTFLRSL
jgi:CxxC motif-containing protein (DUF1111 family)